MISRVDGIWGLFLDLVIIGIVYLLAIWVIGEFQFPAILATIVRVVAVVVAVWEGVVFFRNKVA